jgi:hypothetical protein
VDPVPDPLLFFGSAGNRTQASHQEKVWVSECRDPVFLTSALAGGEWSASRSGCFVPDKQAPYIHSIGGWVGPRAGLDNTEK